jgi:NADH-quinone oxidoreductase subunit K
MILIALWIVGMGMFSLILRRTLLGVLVGAQLIILGSTMVFVVGGSLSESMADSNVIGILVVLSGLAQLVAGGVLAIRLYYLRKRIFIKDLRLLKH